MAAAISAELVTIIRSSLDASAFQVGANLVDAATKKMILSGRESVVVQKDQQKLLLDSGKAFDNYRRGVDESYKNLQRFVDIQTAANKAVIAGRTTQETAQHVLDQWGIRLGVVSSEMADATRKTEEFAAATKAAATAQAELSRASDAANALRASIDPLFAASKRYEAQLDLVSRALATGVINAEAAALATERFTSAFSESFSPLGRGISLVNQFTTVQAEAARRTEATTASIRAQSNAQAAYAARRTSDGPDQLRTGGTAPDPLSGEDYAKRQADLEAYAKAMEDLRAKTDPVYAASKAYEKQLDLVTQAQKTGAISARAAELEMERLTAAYAASHAPLDGLLLKTRLLSAAEDEMTRRMIAAETAQRTSRNALASANSRTGTAATNPLFGVDFSKVQADTDAYAAAMDRLRAAIDPVYAASKAYEMELMAVANAQAFGAVTADQAEIAMERITAAFAASNAPLQGTEHALLAAAAAQRKLASDTEIATRAARDQNKVQAEINAQMKASQKPADVVRDRAAEAQAKEDRLRAQYDPEFAIYQAAEKKRSDISKLANSGAITEEVATAARAKASKEFSKSIEDLEKSTEEQGKLQLATAGTAREFMVLGHEVVTGNFNRIPGSLMVLAERMGELDKIAELAWKAITSPVGLAIIGFAAVSASVVALGVYAEVTSRRLNEMMDMMAARRNDFRDMANEATDAAYHIAAVTPGISTTDARAATAALGGAPQFHGSQKDLEALTKAANDLAMSLGTSLPEEAKALAGAMKDAGQEAQILSDKGFRPFDQTLVDHIKLLVESGDRTRAFAEFMVALQKAVGGATERVTPLEQAFSDLAKAITGADHAARSGEQGFGATVNAAMVDQVHAMTDDILSIKWYFDAIAAGVNWATGRAAVAPLPEGVGESAGAGQGRPISDAAQEKLFASARALENIAPAVADLSIKIAGVESGGSQFNVHGGVLKSSAGALGEMQVMPATAAGYNEAHGTHYDITKEEDNRRMGLLILQDLYTQFRHDIRSVEIGYNAGPDKVGSPLLKKETSEYLTKMERQPGASPGIGPQYLGPPSPEGDVYGVRQTSQDRIDAAQKERDAAGVLSKLLTENEAKQATEVAGIEDARKRLLDANATGNQEEVDKIIKQITLWNEALVKLKGAHTDLLQPQQLLARAAEDAVRPLTAEAGAARQFADIVNKYRIKARETTGDEMNIDVTAMGAELAAERTKLAAAANDNTQKVVREGAAIAGRTALVKEGAAAVELQANADRAAEDARQYGEVGDAAYVKARDDEVAALNRVTMAKYGLDNAEHTDALKREAADLAALLPLQKGNALALEMQVNLEKAVTYARTKGVEGSTEYNRALNETVAALNLATVAHARNAAASEMGALEREARNLERMVPIIEKGGQAAEYAANQHKSEDIARKTALPGIEAQNAAMAEAKATLDAVTTAEHDVSAARDIKGMDDELERLRLEAKLIYATAEARAKELAILKERQKLNLSPGETAPAGPQADAVNKAAEVAAQGAQTAQQIRDAGEAAQFTGELFNTMGDAMTTAFKKGETAGMRFRDTMATMVKEVEKELMKLAVINPLMNALFGGDRPTLTGQNGQGGVMGSLLTKGASLVGDLFSGSGGGGGSWSGSGGAVTASATDIASTASGGSGMLVGGVHTGGVVPLFPSWNLVDPAVFANASRYHSGLAGDEFPAILQRGERVLTAQQNRALTTPANSNSARQIQQPTVNFHINTPNADSFKASQGQLYAKAQSALWKQNRRGG